VKQERVEEKERERKFFLFFLVEFYRSFFSAPLLALAAFFSLLPLYLSLSSRVSVTSVKGQQQKRVCV
jgi:hypothetical protein